MTEEYELFTFDRHSLNYDNVALGRLPTNVTTDPSVRQCVSNNTKRRDDPHEVPDRATWRQQQDDTTFLILAALPFVALSLFFGTKGGYYDSDDYTGGDVLTM